MKKIDERDTMLSRINAAGTPTYDPYYSPFADSGFEFLSQIKHLSKQLPKGLAMSMTPEESTRKIKAMAKYLGATDVGITQMAPHHYYSHRGRSIEQYGKEVGEPYAYGIVFTAEMDREMINRAPQLEEMIEVVKAYVDLAVMGMWLSIFIGNLGYEAKNNMDMDYLVCAPIVAQDAGLGQIGRAGLLVTKKQGMRVRIGVVTTNMPLIPDTPDDFGLLDFCAICKKCAINCPSKALDLGAARWTEKGYFGHEVLQENCIKMWKTLGTDCGICLSSCPFSQGIDQDSIKQMKGDLKLMKHILNEDEQKYGKRAYLKDKLDLLK